MKISSNLLCNVSINAGGLRITVPASPAILELDDDKFKAFVPKLKSLVQEGSLAWNKAPALSEKEQADSDAKAIATAEALIKSAYNKPKKD